MAKIKFELTYDTTTGSFSVVNTETGETQEIKNSTSTKKSSVKDDGDPTPKLTLESSKYTLNKAAADLLIDSNVDENRLEIKYDKCGKILSPQIGNNIAFGTKGGNKVTKSLTVACRGKANDELSKYGSVFILEPVKGKDGIYWLVGENEMPELNGDENVNLPEEDNDLTDDELNLEGIIKDNNNSEEANEFDFEI